MNEATLRAFQILVNPDEGNYQLVSYRNGRRMLLAFGLSKERAEEWQKFWPHSYVEERHENTNRKI
ncbi:MAG: hypothetical protein JW943_07815 [Deltaproteobacteria bacterium]|nr:hypothetical protein [Deltaproteobacteria bacterium]